MLKVVSRAARAKNQAHKVLTRFNKKKESLRLKDDMRQEKNRLRALAAEAQASRKETKEDRMLGPLAPRRALTMEEVEGYGAVAQERIATEYVPKDKRIRYWNIVINDRVVVLKGQDRHKIGVVKAVDKKRNEVVVGGMNKVPVKIPESFHRPGEPRVMSREVPLNYYDVRLVYPLSDPETGVLKDTIIANVEMSKIWHNKRKRTKEWDRLVPGMKGVTIPWPEKQKPEPIDQLADTRIYDVETRTFMPTLLKPPFPVSVIDELRNKYSKYRTRHDPEYIAKKEAEHLGRVARETAKVLTPVQELNKKAREERKALGKPVLSDAMLERIGRVMAYNRPELLEGIQAVSAGEEAVL